MPEVSVIVPIYNTEAYLEDCLGSLQSQTFRDFEAILVNDGSTDGSMSIAQSYVDQDKRFRLVSQENAGLSEARNAGIGFSIGNYITFVDSDDILDPQFLEVLLEAARETRADIVCSGKKPFCTNGRQKTKSGGDVPQEAMVRHTPFKCPPLKKKVAKCLHAIQSYTPEKALENALYQKDSPDYSAWNKLFASYLWITQSFPKGAFFEDMATIPQVMLEANRVIFIPQPMYHYRVRSESILHTAYTPKKAELLDIAENLYLQIQLEHPEIESAAQSNLLSASFSIMMRTPDSEEFSAYRTRAWNWIKAFRFGVIFNPRTRFRNKAAAALSFIGPKYFSRFFGKVKA